MGARASVVLLTFNGEKYLRDVVEGIFAQQTDFSCEVIVIDSGSSDATLDILSEYPVQLHQIPNSDFNHGDTRNLGARLSSGEFVAYITQSAIPADRHWLQHLISAFDIDPRVAAVYGLHIPRQDCDPVTRRDITEFFKLHGPPDQPTIIFRRNGRDGEPEYPVDPHVAEFYSDVNSCLRKSVWQKIPYQPLDYAEDQAFGRDMLASGYWKVYEPRAAVYHSHSYPPVKFFRRQFDEYRGLRTSIGYRQPGGIRHVIFDGGRGGLVDSKYILRLPKSPSAKAKWIGYAFLVNFLRRLAGYLAARDRLPAPIVRGISLEAQLKRTASQKLRRPQQGGSI
jgi:rhamnosyltransferase